MPIDPRARRLLDMLALSTAKVDTTAGRRENFRKLMAMADTPGPDIATEDRDANGVPVRIYRPGNARSALIFFHGGGLVAGSIITHDGMCRRLALASGAIVISVDYRLAPEWPYPAALEDAVITRDWVTSSAGSLGIDVGRIAVGGDSAGALLAVQCAAGPATGLRAVLLLCPVVDLMKQDGSRAEFAEGYLIDSATIARDIADCFRGEAKPPSLLRDVYLAALPPVIIHAAEYDPFRDEAFDLSNALRNVRVSAEYTCHPGMLHGFHGLGGFLPQAGPALDQAGRQVASCLD